jgi:hypothetical protein
MTILINLMILLVKEFIYGWGKICNQLVILLTAISFSKLRHIKIAKPKGITERKSYEQQRKES